MQICNFIRDREGPLIIYQRNYAAGPLPDSSKKLKRMENQDSTGRLFIFNPDCELAIANGGKYYMPPSNIVQMAEDLAFLPAYLGGAGDKVLVKNMPDEYFMKTVIRPLRVACCPVTEENCAVGGLRGMAWGSSPRMNHWLACRGMGEEWRTEQKDWYSRKTALEGLIRLQKKLPFIEKSIIPRVCQRITEIEEFIREGSYIVKAPWSSSGKGILCVEKSLAEKEKEWISGMLGRQGYLMLEKKLQKVQDFAMEFRAEEGKVVFIGWSAFTTGSRGEYRGNYIGPQSKVENSLNAAVGYPLTEQLKETMPEILKGLLPIYKGYLGVDMMLYRDTEGKMRVHPCLEINLRCNMGIVALFLSERYLNEGSEGMFSIRFYPKKGEAVTEYQRLLQDMPPLYKNNRICSGYLNLTPVTASTCFIASVRCY